jgi:HMG (high mobility group) box
MSNSSNIANDDSTANNNHRQQPLRISQIIAAMWRELSEFERNPYYEQAQVLRKQHTVRRRNLWRIARAPPTPPPSAYKLFYRERRQYVVYLTNEQQQRTIQTIESSTTTGINDENYNNENSIGNSNNREPLSISQTIATMWNGLSENEKRPYYEQAQALLDQYNVELQIWMPTRRRRRRNVT